MPSAHRATSPTSSLHAATATPLHPVMAYSTSLFCNCSIRSGTTQKSSSATQLTRAMDELRIQFILVLHCSPRDGWIVLGTPLPEPPVAEPSITGRSSTAQRPPGCCRPFSPCFDEQFGMPARQPEVAHCPPAQALNGVHQPAFATRNQPHQRQRAGLREVSIRSIPRELRMVKTWSGSIRAANDPVLVGTVDRSGP